MIFFTNLQLASRQQNHRGFGLIELLVSISIMVLVTTIVLAGHSSFSSSVLVRSQAYEVALRLREVQLAAVGAAGDGVSNFRTLSGAQFNTSSAESSRYVIFSTPNLNTNWQLSFTQSGPVGVLDQRFVVTDISALSGSGDSVTPLNGTPVQIVFNRPNFDARFFSNGTELTSPHTLVISIGARGSSHPNSNERRVIVTKSGQISVE